MIRLLFLLMMLLATATAGRAQNEGTIAGNTQYIIFGSSFKNIIKD